MVGDRWTGIKDTLLVVGESESGTLRSLRPRWGFRSQPRVLDLDSVDRVVFLGKGFPETNLSVCSKLFIQVPLRRSAETLTLL